MPDFKLNSLTFIDTYDIVDDVISQNVTDINTNRSGNRWVYPTFPEKTNSYNLPQVIIEFKINREDNDSAADYLTEYYDNNSNSYKVLTYKKVEATCQIYVITLKEKAFTVTFNGANKYFSEKPLNLYVKEMVKKALVEKRSDLLTVFDEFRPRVGGETTYENGEHTWVTQLSIPVEYKNVYVNEYQDGELIASYDLNKTIQTG